MIAFFMAAPLCVAAALCLWCALEQAKDEAAMAAVLAIIATHDSEREDSDAA